MPAQTQSFKNYLKRRDAMIEAEKKAKEDEVEEREIYNEKTFYRAFVKDCLRRTKRSLYIVPL